MSQAQGAMAGNMEMLQHLQGRAGLPLSGAANAPQRESLAGHAANR